MTKENFSSGICVTDSCCCPDVMPHISWHITRFVQKPHWAQVSVLTGPP